ncbi:hypothetical protein FA95DRAFT_1371839 [Auriscalpium vulgare]|uniref:Uncharacterized protein n=1 Tax=Auriscalpium vulgare TaxID=40419 RepID=A0ACB8RRE8_9AGAM|nr:hypothetical protein FA95DRAFT_1371839 [Auriscalpium vulgare]
MVHQVSAFDRALDEYFKGLPAESKKSKFIEHCLNSDAKGPEAINDLIQKEKAKNTLSGPVSRLFQRITHALKDYSEVIGQIVSVQPIPAAIIWGALKIIVEGAARWRDMLDTIKTGLRTLTDQINRLTDYENLYSTSSERLRETLVRFFKHMIDFWYRVHKECHRTRLSTIGHSMTSSASQKLSGIVEDIEYDVTSILQEADICQAKMMKDEAEKSQEDRIVRSDWRNKQNAVNHVQLCQLVRAHLTTEMSGTNLKYHEHKLQHQQEGTCSWLLNNRDYAAWKNPNCPEQRHLCLSGRLGCGKSMLSSFAIRDVQKSAAAAYYFCQFSQPCDSPYELLRLLTLQLFNAYVAQRLPVDAFISGQFCDSKSSEDLHELIRELVKNLTPTYFFIDGLDEAQGSSHYHVSAVVNFLVNLCDQSDGRVRLWCTMRHQPRPVDCYDAIIAPSPHLELKITDHTKTDVESYLDAKFLALKARFVADGDESRDYVQLAHNYLKSRADGNFLWAQLMTQNFDGENRIDTVRELKDIVTTAPSELGDLFKSILLRIKPGDRKIASKVIAVVAFARRHLRIEEIREVVLLLTTRGKKNANDFGLRTMSAETFLSKYTALIEFDKDAPDSDSAGTCRLIHSSALDYLVANQDVLATKDSERALHITPFTIADACLRYLTLSQYSKPLQKLLQGDNTHVWRDTDKVSMDDHHFAQYAAKYWARHLEDVKPDAALHRRVEDFVTGPTFQTCIQMQTLWVQGKFDVYCVLGRPSLLRVLPNWFIRDNARKTLSKHWNDYRLLLHNWQEFLSCGGCHDFNPECKSLAYRGEVDRLWWAALGPGHIFSRFQSRYTSFRLAEDSDDGDVGHGERFEALSVVDGRITTLRLSSWDHTQRVLEFICERWIACDSSSAPTLRTKQIIRTDEAATNWCMYAKRSTEEAVQLVARPTMFSEDGGLLRIGAQLFYLDDKHHYQPLTRADAKDNGCPSYFEEFSGRGSLVAIGSRAFTTARELQTTDRTFGDFGKDFARMERVVCEDDGFYGVDSDEGDELSDGSSDSDSVEEGYESWSEGSSDTEEDLDSDFDEDEGPASSSDDDDTEDEEQDSTSEEEDTKSETSEDLPPLSINATAELLRALKSQPDLDSDDEEGIWGLEVDAHLGTFTGHVHPALKEGSASREPEILLTIFDTSAGGSPKKVFQYSHSLSFMLYASPPVMHPNKSLVVWPLGAGDMLFADFIANTYFVRKLRPSAPRTRHISVKLRFSRCGQYLHIASLEAQTPKSRRRPPRPRPTESQPLPELRIFLLLSTYRLSSRNHTRSPPTLVHRVKVDLGGHEALSVLRLPFTFTWTESDLFVTHSTNILAVNRISLYRRANMCAQKTQNVLVPKNTTFLPDTAAAREVHFVPPADGRQACVIVGSESRTGNIAFINLPSQPEMQLAAEVTDAMTGGDRRGMLSPPVGCYLKDEDLGEWVRSEDVPVPKGRGVCKLDRRKEKFDPDDDCDVEPYLRFV